ncbi:hypothetical protein EDB89DRAFT_2231116 [Lactarius sanguifluus]|nr:hypothetical protein EDB89DRAFT_2231116 [Lactarius sanguifluus]
MDYEDDVLQYYRQFLCYSAPLVHSGHLTEEDRNAAFWYGFHPKDREVLRPHLIGKNPFQPSDVPFHFKDIFVCARGTFAYGNLLPPWLHEQQFQSSGVRCERPVAKHGSRDTYGLREMSRAATLNAETTSNLDELPSISSSPYSTPDTQLLSSSSHSVSESQHMQALSVTLDQPEPAYTLSTTLPPSASFPTLSHASSLARSATDNEPNFASMPPSSSVSSTFLPSATSHTPALIHLASDSDPIPASTPPSFSLIPSAFPTPTHTDLLARSDVEISSLHPLSSIMPASTMPPISSDFDYLPSATVDQSAPTLTSTPASSSSVSSTFLPSPVSMRSAMNSQPEPESALASESLDPPSIGHVPDITSTPSLVLLTNFECLPSAMVDQPEFESRHVPLSLSTPTPPSLPAPSPALEFTDDVRELLSLPPTPQSASLARSEVPTSLSSPTRPSPSENPTLVPAHSLPSLRPSPEESCCNLVLEPLATPASSYPHVSPSSLGELIPLLPAQHEVSVTVPTLRHSTPPQQPPGFKTVGSDCSTLEVTPAPASPTTPSVPQPRESPLVYYEVSSMLAAPRFSLTSPPLPLSRFGLAHNFTLAIVIATAFVSTLINLSKTLLTHLRKFQSKYEDFGNSQNGIPEARNIPTQRLRLGYLTPRALRFVFDPGGQPSSSSFKLPLAHKDIRQSKTTTRSGCTTLDTSLPHSRSNRQPRFRPRRSSVHVRAGT